MSIDSSYVKGGYFVLKFPDGGYMKYKGNNDSYSGWSVDEVVRVKPIQRTVMQYEQCN